MNIHYHDHPFMHKTEEEPLGNSQSQHILFSSTASPNCRHNTLHHQENLHITQTHPQHVKRQDKFLFCISKKPVGFSLFWCVLFAPCKFIHLGEGILCVWEDPPTEGSEGISPIDQETRVTSFRVGRNRMEMRLCCLPCPKRRLDLT